MLHDYVRFHTNLASRALLDSFDWNVLNHPTYSPNLTLLDQHIFTLLKAHMIEIQFLTEEQVQKKLTTCIERDSDYVEKWSTSVSKQYPVFFQSNKICKQFLKN